MKYNFVFATQTYDEPGNPPMLKGATLDERFDPKALDKEHPEGYLSWHKPTNSGRYTIDEALAFPELLWLNTGERKLHFDFRVDMHGIIFSKEFFDACGTALKESHKIARLNVVNRKGAQITHSDMFYGKCKIPQQVLDPDLSSVSRETVQVGILPLEMDVIHHFSLSANIHGTIVEPTDLEKCILFEADLSRELKERNLIGFNPVSQSDFIHRYNDRNMTRTRSGELVSPFG